MSRRIALVALALATVAVFATGAFGFTSVSADRGVSVAVVEDDEAFVGVDPAPLDRCGEQRLVTVTNRFAEPVTASVTVTDAKGVTVAAVDSPDGPIPPGEAATATVRLNPDAEAATDGGEGSITVSVDVEGDGVRATLSRTYDTLCAESSENASDGTTGTPSTDADATDSNSTATSSE